MPDTMMPALAKDAANWRGPDFAGDESWILHFSMEDLAELDAALRGVEARGTKLADLTAADFPLPHLAAKLAGHLETLRSGRGFVVLRGLPVARYDDAQVGTIFYGMGLHLGRPLAQNPMGDLLGHVFDQGRKYGEMGVRGYETNAYLPFHTDGCEMVGLLCLRRARAGGLSSISSAVAVHEEIARRAPECLAPLYRGFHYIRREAAHTESPVSPHEIPVFGVQDGLVSCRMVGNQIEAAAVKTERPITGVDRRALDLFKEISGSPELRLDMDLEVGDIQLINNYTILHSRTEYEDWLEPERRRHMLRLWLAFADSPRPLADGFARQLGYQRDSLVEIHLQGTAR